jgi:hypothetical protein
MNRRGSIDPEGMLNGAKIKLRKTQANSRTSRSDRSLPLLLSVLVSPSVAIAPALFGRPGPVKARVAIAAATPM